MERQSGFELDVMMQWVAGSPISPGEVHDALFEDVELSEVVALALNDATKPTKRQRNLPNDVILWVVVAMSLFRHVALTQLTQRLGVLGDAGKRLASSSISEARTRLGTGPLRVLFEELSMRWAHQAASFHPWKGLSVYAMDGTTLAVSDSEANDAHFGRPSSRTGVAGYPRVRLVALVASRSRLLVDASFGPCTGKGTGETTLAGPLWDGVPDDSVLLFDRGFIDTGRMWWFLTQHPSRHFVTREAAKLTWTEVQKLGSHDAIVDLRVSKAARRQHNDAPETIRLRRIEYQFEGHKPSALLTSLLDADRYPAAEVIDLYHERWDIELVYRDVKLTQLQRQETLRSRTPEGVSQEIYGLLTAYQIIRKRMLTVAEELGVPPRRLSFKSSLIAVQSFCMQMTVPLHSDEWIRMSFDILDNAIASGVMPLRKKRRSYPRHVKVKISNYKRNRGRPRDSNLRSPTKKP